MKLTNSYRIRLSNDDIILLDRLKQLGVKPTKFIRTSIRDKIKREFASLLIKEEILKSKEYCPF